MPFKTTIRKPDKVFSEYVRKRDKRCVFGVKCLSIEAWKEGDLDISRLQCCHFHSRRKESVRFDPENSDAGCVACHLWLDGTAEGKIFHKEFKRKQLGDRAYDLLELRANQTKKRDDQWDLLYAKELLSSL